MAACNEAKGRSRSRGHEKEREKEKVLLSALVNPSQPYQQQCPVLWIPERGESERIPPRGRRRYPGGEARLIENDVLFPKSPFIHS